MRNTKQTQANKASAQKSQAKEKNKLRTRLLKLFKNEPDLKRTATHVPSASKLDTHEKYITTKQAVLKKQEHKKQAVKNEKNLDKKMANFKKVAHANGGTHSNSKSKKNKKNKSPPTLQEKAKQTKPTTQQSETKNSKKPPITNNGNGKTKKRQASAEAGSNVAPQKKKLKKHLQQTVAKNESVEDEEDPLLKMLQNYSTDEEEVSSEDYDYDTEEEQVTEEEEHYSDFDEDHYECEEEFSDDETDYTEEDNSTVDSNEHYYFNSEDDDDYKLPPDVPEDLIIHKGTAETRPLQLNDNIEFDSDNEDAQVVELEEQPTVICVKQPKGYEKEELLKLNEREIENLTKETTLQAEVQDDDVASTSTECPQLVPIVDEDGFELYSPHMDYDNMEEYDISDESDIFSLGEEMCSSDASVYEECSDDDSLISVDVNSKYMKETHSCDDDDDECKKAKKMKADIITLEKSVFEKPPLMQAHQASAKEHEEQLLATEELPSLRIAKHSNVLESNIISTPIVEIQKLNAIVKPVMLDETTCETTNSTATVSDESVQQLETSPMRVKCKSLRSIFCNGIDSNHVLVLLKDSFYMYGTMRLVLITGSVEIYGHTPQPGNELEIFSPRGYSAVQIVPKPNIHITKEQIAVELKRLEVYFSQADLKRILKNYQIPSDALIILRRNVERKRIVNNFKKYMNENVFPNMNTIQMERPLYASEFLLRCNINAESDKALKVPNAWSQLQLNSDSKMMFVGGKSVGKSTLLRYMVNRHLRQFKQLLLVDLDIGQPELFVPQTISCTVLEQPLLGPGCFLNRQPARAYMIGHANIVLCAHAYVDAVKQLMHFCHNNNEYAHMPWLINTMGYNKGFGLELIAVLSELVRPSDIVQLQSNKNINNFDVILEPQVLINVPRTMYVGEKYKPETAYVPRYRLHIYNSAILQQSRYQQEWEMSAKDMRYAIILARLSDALQGNSEWLTDCKPLSAPLSCLKLINPLSSEYTREEILEAMEVNMVYLCNLQNDANTNTALLCYGIGVVRGIDYHLNQIYLLPAMPYQQMSQVNCLALGEMPLPTSILTNQGPKVKNSAPFVYNTIDANASKAIKQIYHRPAEFLTGHHKNVDQT